VGHVPVLPHLLADAVRGRGGGVGVGGDPRARDGPNSTRALGGWTADGGLGKRYLRPIAPPCHVESFKGAPLSTDVFPMQRTTAIVLFKVAVLIVSIGLWYLAVLPFLFRRWSPPDCGNPCAGPSSWPATLIVVGALAPLILTFFLTARSWRVVAFCVAAALVSAVAFAIASWFADRVCPNVYANGCHDRGAIALLAWMAYIGPVLIASFALGPIRGRSWTSHLALALAGLIGLAVAAAPSAIEEAHIDGDTFSSS
jgi:hypothetical protein